MTVEPRSSWAVRTMTCRDREPDPYTAGAAVHWPGIKGRLRLTTHELCRAKLRNLEAEQMDRPPPGDYGALAYQVVVCPHARVLEGRTRSKVNGANGDTPANLRFGSIMVLVGTDDEVTDAMLSAVWDAARYLGAPKLLTHNQVRPEPTACPGPFLSEWIKAGAPDPEDDMPTAAEIAQATVALLMRTQMQNRPKIVAGDPDATSSYKSLLEGTYLRAFMAADPKALAAQLAPLLPADAPATEDALEAALRRVLGSLDDDAG